MMRRHAPDCCSVPLIEVLPMQRTTQPDRFFWAHHGSREAYAGVRRSEASAATAKIGVSNLEYLSFGDQLLYRALAAAFLSVCDIVRRRKPDTVLVPAYEGGHPDHDSCRFLGALLRRKLGLSIWEMPLYHRSTTGKTDLTRIPIVERNGICT